MQDLDVVGSVFGSTRMSFETQDFQIAKGLMNILKNNSSGNRSIARTENHPMLTGRQIAFMIRTFFKIHDVHVRTICTMTC